MPTFAQCSVLDANHFPQIPFTVTGQEIAQFIARYAHNNPMIKKHYEGYPIHIIMEKPTGKTMDCFVEFPSYQAARECVTRFEQTAQPGRGTKLGTRNVSLDLSNQAELMRAIFPRARLVRFEEANGQPHIMSREEDPSWSEGFRGYFTLEELYGVTRFAENPSRVSNSPDLHHDQTTDSFWQSPFVLKCNQRVYESLISTLYKFPWPAIKTFTVAARNALYEAAYRQVTVLLKKVGDPNMAGNFNAINSCSQSGQDYGQEYHHGYNQYHGRTEPVQREVGLSQTLLLDLLFAALNVPAFSLLQKFLLCLQAGPFGRGVPLTQFAQHWPFQTLAPAANVPDHVTKFWLELFDTGFDLVSDERTETTYEQFISFNRNKVGFPVAEWTHSGVELLFEDAMRIEIAAMMVYVNRGREAWAQERGLNVSRWEVTGLGELMRIIEEEKLAGGHPECGETRIQDFADNSISPTATIIGPRTQTAANKNNGLGAGYGAIGEPIKRKSSASSDAKLGPATAVDFVPASAQGRPSGSIAPIISHSSIANIWAHPSPAQGQPSRSSFPRVDTNAADSATARDNFDQGRPSKLPIPFRNPFANAPSTKEQPHIRNSYGDYSHQVTVTPRASALPNSPSLASGSFNTIQEGNSSSNNRMQANATPYNRHGNAQAHARNFSPFEFTNRSSINSVGEQVNGLSLATNGSSNIAETALDRTTSHSGLGAASSSFSKISRAPVGSDDSPTPRRIQKYPNITLSTIESNSAPSFQSGMSVSSTAPYPSAAPAQSASAERARTQSIPVSVAVGHGASLGKRNSESASTGPPQGGL